MNTKKKFLYFFLFEYKTLEEYLKEMAKEGWMLNNISPTPRTSMSFEACIPKEYYFYVDFISNYDVWYPDIANEEVLKYRSFIEEYGYVFLVSNGPMQIFVSDVPIDMPIREQSIETKKEMKKASLKYAGSCLCLGLLWLTIPLIDIFNDSYKEVFYWTSMSNVFRFLTYLLYASFFLSFAYPVIRWMIHEKKKYSLWRIKIRSSLQILLFVLLILNLMIWNMSMQLYWFFLCLLLSVCLIILFYKAISKLCKKNYIAIVASLIVASILLVLSVQVIEYTTANIYETTAEKQAVESVIPNAYFNLDESIRFDVDIEDSVFMKDESYSYCKGLEETYEYDVIHVKDTIWKNFKVHAITTNDVQQEERLGEYTIYTMDYWILIQHEDTFLMFRVSEYEPFTQQEFDVIFERIQP